MFWHNFKYALKTLARDRMLIFWTFAFPLILGTLFQMAFANIESSEEFSPITIAIVENDAWKQRTVWNEAFTKLSEEGSDEQLFHTRYTSEEEAKELLETDEISGYLMMKDTPQVVVDASGVNETIFKHVCEELIQSETLTDMIVEKQTAKWMANPDQMINDPAWQTRLYEEVNEILQAETTMVQDASPTKMSYTMIEFYTLIAMTCLYGGVLAMVAMNRNLADMSDSGKRVAVSPASKGSLVLSSISAAYVVQLLGLTLLFSFTCFVLHVDYGENFIGVLGLAVVGSLAGLALGICVAALCKRNEATKTGILISITMLGSFLSGMMGITMKYIVDTNFSWLNRLNPAAMITDGYYSLYFYDTMDRYFNNIIGLLIFSAVLLLVAAFKVKRQTYDSI